MRVHGRRAPGRRCAASGNRQCAENAAIRRSSLLDARTKTTTTPPCGELRERFELDAVVAGAQTEFEAIERLMAWAYAVPLGACRHYPWNVLDWLVLERDESGAIVNESVQATAARQDVPVSERGARGRVSELRLSRRVM